MAHISAVFVDIKDETKGSSSLYQLSRRFKSGVHCHTDFCAPLLVHSKLLLGFRRANSPVAKYFLVIQRRWLAQPSLEVVTEKETPSYVGYAMPK